MKAFYLVGILICLISVRSHSQQLLRGQVKAGNQAISYSTVGISQANVGTLTNELGQFELSIPPNLQAGKLVVSHIGYNRRELALDSLLQLDYVVIRLSEREDYLNEVLVTAKQTKGKLKTLGNTRQHNMFLWLQNGDVGSEIATLIEPKRPMVLKSVSVNILNDRNKNFTLLLNLYSVNSTSGLPDKQLLKQQKIVASNLAEGWLNVDISGENLIMEEAFFVGFQWVNIDETVPLIGGKTSSTSKSLVRYKALGTWNKYAAWDIKATGFLLRN
jgi:hypothetical protein